MNSFGGRTDAPCHKAKSSETIWPKTDRETKLNAVSDAGGYYNRRGIMTAYRPPTHVTSELDTVQALPTWRLVVLLTWRFEGVAAALSLKLRLVAMTTFSDARQAVIIVNTLSTS